MEEFNPISKLVNNDTISPTELTKNKTYPLLKLEKVESKYGDALIASISIKNVVKKVYLPKVYTSNLSDEALEKINDEPFDLKYLGPEGKSHKYVLTTKPKTKKRSQKKVESDEEEEKPKKKKKVSKKEEVDEDDEKEKKKKKNTKKPVQKKPKTMKKIKESECEDDDDDEEEEDEEEEIPKKEKKRKKLLPKLIESEESDSD